jgi:hypothetical protein
MYAGRQDERFWSLTIGDQILSSAAPGVMVSVGLILFKRVGRIEAELFGTNV